AVLLKGGHAEGDRATDYLLYRGKVYAFESPKLPKDPRGTGCVLSSALLGYLVKGYPLPEAVKKAKELVYKAIVRAEKLGRCREVLLLD
ncbi:MAG: bifunctional hydroxymethylpyrimidine kinase/phosphomethylpyrimidine kinase, partial [Aquificae bacterium]|nr:bifunctional hydroxymethylpyrimidine kinase/phosphomethylpyrimidine kinase [Aquificota bacterium]